MENKLGIVIKCTPEQAWAVLADPSRLPQWLTREGPFPHVIKVDGQPGPDQIWRADAVDGQTAIFTVTVWDEPQLLTYELTSVPGAPLSVSQVNRFDLDIDETGTLVTWQVTWQLAEPRFVTRILQERQLDKDIETMQMYSLQRLKEIIEIEVSNDDQAEPGSDDDTEAPDSD